MAVATLKAKTASAFPEAFVEKALREELISLAREKAQVDGTQVPADSDALVGFPIGLDSLLVVNNLCALDEILSFEVGENVVKAGGYDSIKDAMEHLMPRLRREWAKHHAGG